METILQNICDNFNIDAIIILGCDPHQLEYPPEIFKLRHYISGFHGSAGSFVCYKRQSHISTALWTDGRYESAAKQCVSQYTELIISKEQDWNAQITWLVKKHKKSFDTQASNTPLKIGISSLQVSVKNFLLIQKIAHDQGVEIIPLDYFEVLSHIKYSNNAAFDKMFRTQVSDDSKKNSLQRTIFSLATAQATHTHSSQYDIRPLDIKENKEKFEKLKDFLTQAEADIYLSANIHELAWLSHLRAQCIPYLMLFSACFSFHKSHNTLNLWLDEDHLDEASKQDIAQLATVLSITINIHNYHDFLYHPELVIDYIFQQANGKHIIFDANNIPYSLYKDTFTPCTSPLLLWKSIRTTQEILHSKYAQDIDNSSLLIAMSKISRSYMHNNEISEHEAADIILRERKMSSHFLQSSFETISASGAHAALPHYTYSNPAPQILAKKLYLLDCGAHYLYGTTDLTRVYYLDSFDKAQVPSVFKEDFTHVLKAHITLACYTKPIHSDADLPTGLALDTIVRQKLLSYNKKFNHGVGHGLGYCSDVHEGVQRISPLSSQQIFPNMLISNEPAFYRANEWGIRIENIILSKVIDGVFSFETISYFPLQMSLVDISLLNQQERIWIEDYHQSCELHLFSYLDTFKDADIVKQAKEYFYALTCL